MRRNRTQTEGRPLSVVVSRTEYSRGSPPTAMSTPLPGLGGESRGRPATASVEITVELEHAIGFAGAVYDGQHYHPNGRDFVYAAGACVGESVPSKLDVMSCANGSVCALPVICDFTDPHSQHFLRGHNNNVSCVALSPSVSPMCIPQCGNCFTLLWCAAGCQGRLLASGQNGEFADAIVWDFERRELLYRCVPVPSVTPLWLCMHSSVMCGAGSRSMTTA